MDVVLSGSSSEATRRIFNINDVTGSGSSKLCDGEMQMVAKFSTGVVGSATNIVDVAATPRDRTWQAPQQRSSSPYLSPFLDIWEQNSLVVEEVQLRFYTQDSAGAQKVVRFDGTGQDQLGWFNTTNLIEASWEDLTPGNSNAEFIVGPELFGEGWFEMLGLQQGATNGTCHQ